MAVIWKWKQASDHFCNNYIILNTRKFVHRIFLDALQKFRIRKEAWANQEKFVAHIQDGGPIVYLEHVSFLHPSILFAEGDRIITGLTQLKRKLF